MYFQNVQLALILILFAANVRANELKKCLSDNNSTASLILPADENYDRHNYQFDIRNFIYPLGFIVVNLSNDVRIAVKCSRKLNLSIATKCSGHSYEKFSFKDNRTWVIDLSNLKMVKVNRKKMTADVGSGMILSDLTKLLWKEGKLGAVVGSCFSVGISGFALGGGFGTDSRKYGLMSDTIEELEFVTANGEILIANKNKNRELFWAFRGVGGGNFGIVTRFKIKIYDASEPIITIKKYYKIYKFAEIFYIWQEWTVSNPDESITSIIRYYKTNFRIEIIITDKCQSKRQRLFNEAMEKFPNITSQDIFVTDYLKKMDIIGIREYSPGLEMFFKAKSFYVSKKLSFNESEKFASLVKRFPCLLVIKMHGGMVNKPHPSDTAFFHRRSYYIIQFEILNKLTNNSDYESAIMNGTREMENLRMLFGSLAFMDNGYSYRNYEDLELDDWERRYYGENYARLQEVKRKVDPFDFFNFAQSIRL